jgi:general secretion pathway protein G
MWEKMKEKRNQEGFTLIELLIVIIILAILAAIVVFAVGTTTTNAKASACQSDGKTVETAVEAFKAQTGAYPTGMADLTTVGPNGPWLRQVPQATVGNNGYQITLAAPVPPATTTGTVDVITAAGTINFDTETATPATGCYGIT